MTAQPPRPPSDPPSPTTPAGHARLRLRATALGYPEAYEDHPWGERVIKVRGKVFVFFGMDGDALGLSMKLPASSEIALMQPFAQPTGYGLARGGWVTARFDAQEEPPVDILETWIEESYRAVAPKRLVARLDNSAEAR